MPRIIKIGGAWNDQDKADLVREVMSGTLSVHEACVRHGLSQEAVRGWILMFRRSAVEAFDEHLRQTLARQGIDLSDAFGPGFAGTLDDIGVADLIQTLELGRRDGVITVSQDGEESRIWCAAGEIVDAESGHLEGEAALYRTLAMKRGRVVAQFVRTQRQRTIFGPTSALLLNGARRMDECNSLLRRLGAARYSLAPEMPAADVAVSPGEREVMRQFAVPSTVTDALQESDDGDLETLTRIMRLAEKGCLLPVTESSALPVATRPHDALSTAPVMMSFLRPGANQRAAQTSLPTSTRVGLAALAAFGVGWFVLNPFSASTATQASPAVVPVPASAASARAPADGSLLPAAERAALAPSEQERAEQPAPMRDGDVEPAKVSPEPAASPKPASVVAATSVTRPRSRPPALPPVRAALPKGGAAASSHAGPALAATAPSSPPPLPRMQIIEEQTPRMQIVE